MSIPLNDNVKINAPKPSDPRFFAPNNTPWASIVEVEAGIPLTERHPELLVDVMGVIYWWKDGAWVLRESDLVHKTGNETIDGVKSFKKSIKIDSDEPLDAKYLNGKVAYASLDEANTLIPIGIRSPYLTIVVQGVEYWWVDGAWVVKNDTTAINNHISNNSNPHGVTKAQVGLSNVPNLSFSGSNTGDETTSSIQTKRPLKTIEGQSLEGSGNIDLSKSDIGLSNVDNTSDLTKPVSTATQTALNAKEPTITAGTTAQYYRGDKTWQNLSNLATQVEDEFYYDENNVLRPNITTFRQVELNNTLPIPIITLDFEPTFIQSVNVNGVILTQNQYIYTAPNQLDLSGYTPSATPMTIEITYDHFIITNIPL